MKTDDLFRACAISTGVDPALLDRPDPSEELRQATTELIGDLRSVARGEIDIEDMSQTIVRAVRAIAAIEKEETQ